MHLARVGVYIIEGVLGVHCESAEAEKEGNGTEQASEKEERRK